jgi:hypothetical protein
MAATCARFIAIQRQNTPQAHSNSPRDPSNARQKSIHFQALSLTVGAGEQTIRIRVLKLLCSLCVLASLHYPVFYWHRADAVELVDLTLQGGTFFWRPFSVC